MNTNELQKLIHAGWQNKAELQTDTTRLKEIKPAVDTCLSKLQTGELRIAEKKSNGAWEINQWLKQAILLSFAIYPNDVINGGYTQFFDKIPLQFSKYTKSDFERHGSRIVPNACIRQGAHIAPNCVIMPSYINIGAFVDSGTMIDTWATVGSCAQIGKNVHISGGVGIGGVLEPLQAAPTIIEDNCFIGARSEIVEGVIVEENAVISMGVFIGQSTKIYDREKDEIIYGRVPSGAVVVPGTLPSDNGQYSLYAAIIVKKVDAKTRAKVAINELLRGE